jgi:hypothetical protein
VPARLDFLLLLVMIGLFGFIAQVSCILRNEYIQNIDMAWHKDPSDLGTATGDSRTGIFGYLPPSTIQATLSVCMLIAMLHSQIIFVTILERMFFHYAPSIPSVIGSLIILTSAIYVAVSCELYHLGTN